MADQLIADVEYAKFGDGYVTRASVDEEWASIDEADIPSWWFAEQRAAAERRRLGYDPDGPLRPGRRGSARFLPNPAMEAIAAELGLTIDQLRGRLNGDTGGTRNRVSDARFDEIAGLLGLDPEVARERFRS